MLMAKFVTLSCPTCGGKLEITEDIDRFACGHCGNEHIVKRLGAIVSIEPVVAELRKIGYGTDRTASELAINRLSKEISSIKANIQLLKKDIQLLEQDIGLLEERKSSKAAYLLVGVFIIIFWFFGYCGFFNISSGEIVPGTFAIILMFGTCGVGLLMIRDHRKGITKIEASIKENLALIKDIQANINALRQSVADKNAEIIRHKEIVRT
jgi:ribosomal protein S27AE